MWTTIIISSFCFGAFSAFGYHAATKIRNDKEIKEKEKDKKEG